MKKIQLVTDGSCIGNPGPGGWPCILRCGDVEREFRGSEARTTNNRMELTAAINGLRAVQEQCEVELMMRHSMALKTLVARSTKFWPSLMN